MSLESLAPEAEKVIMGGTANKALDAIGGTIGDVQVVEHHGVQDALAAIIKHHDSSLTR